MEKKKVLWIAAAAMVIGAGGYGIYKVQDNRKREAAYQKAKDSLVLMLEENPVSPNNFPCLLLRQILCH